MSSSRRARALTLALLLTRTHATRAQEHGSSAEPHTYVPMELLDREVPLRRGIGNSRETITTESGEAQAFYNQGLTVLDPARKRG